MYLVFENEKRKHPTAGTSITQATAKNGKRAVPCLGGRANLGRFRVKTLVFQLEKWTICKALRTVKDSKYWIGRITLMHALLGLLTWAKERTWLPGMKPSLRELFTLSRFGTCMSLTSNGSVLYYTQDTMKELSEVLAL